MSNENWRLVFKTPFSMQELIKKKGVYINTNAKYKTESFLCTPLIIH